MRPQSSTNQRRGFRSFSGPGLPHGKAYSTNPKGSSSKRAMSRPSACSNSSSVSCFAKADTLSGFLQDLGEIDLAAVFNFVLVAPFLGLTVLQPDKCRRHIRWVVLDDRRQGHIP